MNIFSIFGTCYQFKRDKKKAFSLTEVVIALGIISFAFVGVLGLFSTSFHTSRQSIEKTQLAFMASDIIESLRNEPFDDVASGAGTNIFYFDSDGERLPGSTNAVYLCRVNVSSDPETESNGIPNLLRVRLDFFWPTHIEPPPNTNRAYAFFARR